MPHGLFQRFSGREGKITIPSLGIVVGIFASWNLTQREDGGSGEGFYDLRAVFSYVQPLLLNEETMKKSILLQLSRTKQLRLEQVPDQRTVLEGRSLLMEGVKICQVES